MISYSIYIYFSTLKGPNIIKKTLYKIFANNIYTATKAYQLYKTISFLPSQPIYY